MTKQNLLTLLVVVLCMWSNAIKAETEIKEETMDRVALCMNNYEKLFGGIALNGQGNDPEMMAILQKFIFGEVFANELLDIKQREMITCVALSSMQTLPQLKAHVGAALNVGVTPIEMRELIYLCAPFIGFPRTLNALAVANEVFKERGITLPLPSEQVVTEQNRYEKGLEIQYPLYADAIKGAFADLPNGMGEEVANYLTAYCFGDIYTRGGLDVKTKELLVYAILTTIEAESQLRSHAFGNLKAGNDIATLCAVAIQCLPYVGFPPALKALRILLEVQEEVNT